MGYREIAPPPELRSHVACLWLRTGPPSRVLPDGCVDIVWTGAGLAVAGPATRAVQPAVATEDVKLGVRFRIGAAGAALGLPAGELLDHAPPLGAVWPDGNELAERIAEAADPAARLGELANAVARRVGRVPPPDVLVRAAARDAAQPRARVDTLARRVGLSERQLRRRFEHATGYAPKTLARVLRLQRFLALARNGRPGEPGPLPANGNLARLALEAGYADQAHLTRECRRLTGLPAAALLASGAIPAGESLSRA